MNPWFAKAVVLLVTVALVAIPASVHRGRAAAPVAKSRKGAVERVLLALTTIGFVLPLIWVATPLLAFADYRLHAAPYAAGLASFAAGLWLLHRSHADLGASWSITLEVREGHALVREGVYRRLRHPMYLALLLHGLGQALVVPNAVAGPSYLAAIALLVALRLGPEERMMRETFGAEYQSYAARTQRLIPGLW